MPDNESPIPVTETRTTPDPSNATLAVIAQAVKAERDYVVGGIKVIITRLNAMDEATKVLSENVNRVPTDLQQAIKSFGELMDEKFASIDNTFKAAESLRLEQKQDSKIGLDAALAAQKEAAGTQDINNQKAIDKSEKATAEIIKNNQDANKQAIDTLTKGQDELKLEVSKITAGKQGGENTVAKIYAAIVAVGALLAIIVILANLVFK